MHRLVLQALALALALLVPGASPGGAPSTDVAVAPKTVAVLNFENNSGRDEYENIGAGLAAMTISDLSSVPALQLVERERIREVLVEQELQHTTLFDSSTAVRTGKLVGAEYIVTGSFTAVRPVVHIDTRVISVETGQIVKTAQVTGKEDKLFDLQQKLTDELIDGLDVALSPEDRSLLQQRQEQNRIDELETMALYSRALAAFDAGDYVTAAQRLQPVLAKEPGSMVVQRSLNEAKRRAGNKAAHITGEKVKDKLRGLFGRPR